jgi:hypothetical protein
LFSLFLSFLNLTKGGNEIVTLHGGYIPAIMASYPDIGLDVMKFPRVAGNLIYRS